MRRLALAGAVAMLMLIPATIAGANGCPALEGHGHLNWGHTGAGTAHLVYDGARINVDFFATGGGEHNGHFDIYFDFHFPQGTVEVVEHSYTTPFRGPLVDFDSDLLVTAGGFSEEWEWHGRSNNAGGIAVIRHMSGELCIDA